MANKKSRLAEIYRSEKSKGGGVVSSLGKATVEKLDPRRMFNQRGFLATAFPTIFKAYRAAPGGDVGQKITKLSTPTISGDFNLLTKQVASLTSQMHEVAVNSTIIAKNTMVLPAMARDTNITRQNIAKLVKLQGATASKKADMFFMKSAEREAAYESKFKKEGGEKGPAGAGAAPPPAPGQQKSGLTSILTGLADSMSKGVGIAALGAGIGGFFAGLAVGGSAVNQLGGASGVRDMMINLAEGLKAFDNESFLRFSALLAGGALFGAVTGVKSKAGAVLGIGAVGTGIGLFFSGLSVGGALGDMIGNSAGIKEMMINFAEGLNAFNPASMSAFSALLATGGIFGAVAGGVASLGGAKIAGAVAGGATIGMGLIGTGIGLFLAGLSVGNKLIEFISSGSSPGSSIKDLLVNVSDGMKSFQDIDSNKIREVSKILPGLGAGMLAYFGSNGIAGIISSIGDKMSSFFSFIFGTDNRSPLVKLSEDLQKFNNVNGDNLSKIGQGFKDLTSGMRAFAEAPTTAPTPAAPPPAPPRTPLGTNRMPGAAIPSGSSGSSGSLSAASPLKDYGTYTPSMQSRGMMKNVAGAIIHHTGGDGVSGAISTLKDRGLSYHYIIGKDGTITQLLPEGAVGFHTKNSDKIKGLSNDNTIGISLEARDDSTVTEEQIRAATALNSELSKKFGYPVNNVWGHGEISSHKSPTEGKRVVSSIRSSPEPEVSSPTTGSAIASASSDLANGQRNVSAPNITVVAPTNDTTPVTTSTTPIATSVDRELIRKSNWLTRQTSLMV